MQAVGQPEEPAVLARVAGVEDVADDDLDVADAGAGRDQLVVAREGVRTARGRP